MTGHAGGIGRGHALSPRLERLRRDGARRGVASTPSRLRLLSILIAAAAAALTVVSTGALVAAVVTTIGIHQRTVPAILSMQRIHAWLADADRSAANAYLAGGSEVTLSELQFEADIAAASRELQVASEHNPGGPEASDQLQTIVALVDQYIGLVTTANVNDRLGIAAGTVYLHARTGLMHRPDTGILARVDALRARYAADLDRANRTLQVAGWALALYAAVAVALFGLLVYTQAFVRRRFHRRRNPRLLAATLLVAVAVGASGAGAAQAGQTIRTAEDRTYVRLLNLWNARALLYDANGNESLSLIAREPAARATADAAFRAQTRQLVDRPLTDELVRDARRGVVRFNGRLADELRAARSGEERDGAVHVLDLYRRFMDVDGAVRARAAAGSPAEAIALTLGTNQGQLTFAFADVDWYLGVAIQRLRGQFDDSMTFAERVLVATAVLDLLGLTIVALGFRGLRPRIEEYRSGR